MAANATFYDQDGLIRTTKNGLTSLGSGWNWRNFEPLLASLRLEKVGANSSFISIGGALSRFWLCFDWRKLKPLLTLEEVGTASRFVSIGGS